MADLLKLLGNAVLYGAHDDEPTEKAITMHDAAVPSTENAPAVQSTSTPTRRPASKDDDKHRFLLGPNGTGAKKREDNDGSRMIDVEALLRNHKRPTETVPFGPLTPEFALYHQPAPGMQPHKDPPTPPPPKAIRKIFDIYDFPDPIVQAPNHYHYYQPNPAFQDNPFHAQEKNNDNDNEMEWEYTAASPNDKPMRRPTNVTAVGPIHRLSAGDTPEPLPSTITQRRRRNHHHRRRLGRL